MKLKHFAFVALVALFAACTNQESLLKDYEKACEKGDAVKAAKIIDQMEKKYPNEADWTSEQQMRVEKASIELSKKSLEDASDMLDAFKGL